MTPDHIWILTNNLQLSSYLMSYTFWRNFIIFAIHFADIHRIYIMLTYWEQLVQLSLFSYSNFHDY